MLDNISVICHSSIKFSFKKIIYVDPYKIDENYNDADFIFITHSHYDHYSKEDILKIKNEKTVIIITKDLYSQVTCLGFSDENIIIVSPNNHYRLNDVIEFDTICAYNVNKEFHKKENGWVGYIISINGVKYYIAGDTDITEDNVKVKCDVAFLPIGGKYTMDFKEAANLANIINPKIVVPIHYGTIVGKLEDAEEFSKLLNEEISCIKLL